ncbi:MAG TPA: endonuclease domain-containing protein [Patescibacteria group bacterium]|nr:endonuclease domain-containing protein [Patescibacteria group bacterium]
MVVDHLSTKSSPLVGEGMGEGNIKNNSKKLRLNQTNEEKILWEKLRNRQMFGLKFRRQQSIGEYIVDFVAYENKIIIELDGNRHNDAMVKLKDKKRTKWLENQGFRVLRFWNNELYTNLEGISYAIYKLISHPHSKSLPSRER